jgi:muconolactone delta-isomerase
MAWFLVNFRIEIPPGYNLDSDYIQGLYAEEAKAAAPLFRDGVWKLVFREAGTLHHWALWDAPDADFIHRVYSSFPLFKVGFGRAHVIALADNPNNPGWPKQVVENGDQMPLTWANLYPLALRGETPHPEVSLHTHPGSAFSREVHVMVGGQKVAALGPPDKQEGDQLVGGYVEILARWMDQPVTHRYWQERIARNNGIEPPSAMAESYQHARDTHEARDWHPSDGNPHDETEEPELGTTRSRPTLPSVSVGRGTFVGRGAM